METFIIFLIFVVGSFVQQYLEAKKKKQQRERSRRMAEGSATEKDARAQEREEELRKFLEQLSGGPAVDDEPYVEYEESHEPVVHFDPPPPTPPVVQKAATRAAVPSQDFEAIEEMSDENVYEQVEEVVNLVDMRTEGSESVPQLLDTRTMMVDLSALRYDMLRLPSQRSNVSGNKTTKPKVSNAAGLRRAVLSGIILGPPKALQPDSDSMESGRM